MPRLLLADADPAFARGIQCALERRGFAVEAVLDGLLALNRIQLGLADVCLLSPDLAIMDGLAVLRKARALGATMPVAVLAATATPAARVSWFDAGADDVVGRPFDLQELSARLRAMSRRVVEREARQTLDCGPLSLDILSGSFLLGGGLFELTPKEHAFLRALIVRPGFIVPKDRLFRAVFADAAGQGAIDVLACRVRRRLAGSGVSVATVRGMGYVLAEDQNATRKASSVPVPLRSVATAPEAM